MKKNENGMELNFIQALMFLVPGTLLGGAFIALFVNSYSVGCAIAAFIVGLFFIFTGEFLWGIAILSIYIIGFIMAYCSISIPESEILPLPTKKRKRSLPIILWICAVLAVIGFVVIMLSYKSDPIS